MKAPVAVIVMGVFTVGEILRASKIIRQAEKITARRPRAATLLPFPVWYDEP